MTVVLWYEEATLEDNVTEMKDRGTKDRKNIQILTEYLFLIPYRSAHISTFLINGLFWEVRLQSIQYLTQLK